jgi:hypothetical protein
MVQLSKGQALVLVFVLPTIARLVAPTQDNLAANLIVTTISNGLLGLWLYTILSLTKSKVGIPRNEELAVKYFLVLLCIYPVLSFSLFANLSTMISAGLDLAYISYGLISLYLLSLNFSKLLRAKEILDDQLTIFICLGVYPIGIWRYQDCLK